MKVRSPKGLLFNKHVSLQSDIKAFSKSAFLRYTNALLEYIFSGNIKGFVLP